MGTYKGNAGNLMQHWTLCELLVIAGKHTSELSFIDAHAMAPLARESETGKQDKQFIRVQKGLPEYPESAYEQAWHHLAPNGGYPNSAAFMKQVWEGDFSMLLCETDPSTITELQPWLNRVRELARCKSAKLFQGCWQKRFAEGLPSASKVDLTDGPLMLVSFDPNMYDRNGPPIEPKYENMYPCDLCTVVDAISGVRGGVLIQLSTYSANNANRQTDVLSSIDSILVSRGGFTRAAVVKTNKKMMSLIYARNVSWSPELAILPEHFTEWLNSKG